MRGVESSRAVAGSRRQEELLALPSRLTRLLQLQKHLLELLSPLVSRSFCSCRSTSWVGERLPGARGVGSLPGTRWPSVGVG